MSFRPLLAPRPRLLCFRVLRYYGAPSVATDAKPVGRTEEQSGAGGADDSPPSLAPPGRGLFFHQALALILTLSLPPRCCCCVVLSCCRVVDVVVCCNLQLLFCVLLRFHPGLLYIVEVPQSVSTVFPPPVASVVIRGWWLSVTTARSCGQDTTIR